MICTILAMTAAACLAVMQVRAEAKELATVHVKRADAKLSRAKTKEDIRQVKDLFFSAQRLHFTEEAAAGLKLTEELQLSVDHLLSGGGGGGGGGALVGAEKEKGGHRQLRKTLSSEDAGSVSGHEWGGGRGALTSSADGMQKIDRRPVSTTPARYLARSFNLFLFEHLVKHCLSGGCADRLPATRAAAAGTAALARAARSGQRAGAPRRQSSVGRLSSPSQARSPRLARPWSRRSWRADRPKDVSATLI